MKTNPNQIPFLFPWCSKKKRKKEQDISVFICVLLSFCLFDVVVWLLVILFFRGDDSDVI